MTGKKLEHCAGGRNILCHRRAAGLGFAVAKGSPYIADIAGDSDMPGRPPKQPARPEVRVKPHSYQPSKAELEADVSIDATPEQLARAVLRPVKIVEDPEA